MILNYRIGWFTGRRFKFQTKIALDYHMNEPEERARRAINRIDSIRAVMTLLYEELEKAERERDVAYTEIDSKQGRTR